ncbi:elongation of very long chain fatty acids protein 3 [Suncus etruscus]|uniref:elongation of very long chain fatty acids protein 3 n=1 Tax=Suncus etruscus TaxID=109475 RepID=UPI0021106328|nr:elongation of very long chain fatty acids protein 3 [Suncus etruscus]
MAIPLNITQEMELRYKPYKFEELKTLSNYMDEYWATSFIIVPIYLLLIFVGKTYMKNRKGFNLQKPLILWSFSLAVFSIIGAVRMWGYMSILWHNYNMMNTVCFSIFIDSTTVKFWSSIFAVSKIVELGDTAFIILRKRPLIFVHWYHHSSVLMFTFFGYYKKMPGGGWFMTINFGVHAIMYTYYTLKACHINTPRILPILITSLQILQMVAGLLVSIMVYFWRQEDGCSTTENELFWSALLYISYFILFANFFIRAYIIPKDKAKIKSQ